MSTTQLDVVIVGAGLGGLYQLYRAREAGLRERVVESAGRIDGTWYWNRYSGCRCDIESIAYSNSFLVGFQQEWTDDGPPPVPRRTHTGSTTLAG